MFKRSSQKLEELQDEPPRGKEPSKEPDSFEGELSQLSLMFRISGTVIERIWWQIAVVVLWSTAVVSVWTYVEEAHYDFKPILIQLMGVVCGLLLAFRSNSAYDRYWEGRKYWSQMTLAIRNLTRAIWINVKEESAEDIVEKKSAINLLIAFAIATKHYLREEYDYDFQDLLNITPHLDWLHTPSSNKPFPQQTDEPGTVIVDVATEDATDTNSNTRSRGKKNQKEKATKVKADIELSSAKECRIKAHDIATPTNIPLELSYYIASYINSVEIRKKCESGGAIGSMNSSLGSLVECLTGFERILRTPIPLAYSVHLHQSIWIYILALPFQLPPQNGWWTILVVGITAFFLLGILAIGWEIENPFGHDPNDLPLDDFCQVLKREIDVIVSYRPMVPKDWVFRARNKPFAPECQLNAIVLSTRPLQEIHDMLHVRGTKISENNILSRRDSARIIFSANRQKTLRAQGSVESYDESHEGSEPETGTMLP